MILTRDIVTIGSPPDDPTFKIQATLYWESTLVGVKPFPCFCGTRSAGFSDPGLTELRQFFLSLAPVGFLCMAFQCRLDHPLPGQLTTGTWHQQTDDEKQAIRYMRKIGGIVALQGFDVSGFVGTIGGSGGGHNAGWCAIDGTQGDDKADCAITMSSPTDYSDRTPGPHIVPFAQKCADYASGGDVTQLALLLSRSPVSLPTLAAANPTYRRNGEAENMPVTQLTRMDTAMANAGVTNSNSAILTGLAGTKHSGAEWPYIKDGPDGAIAWALARVAEFDAGGGGGGGGGGTPPPTTEELITAQVSGMDPGVAMECIVTAIDKSTLQEGTPSTPFDFVTDRITIATKDPVIGTYVLMPAPNGIPENFGNRLWWDRSDFDGSRFRVRWNKIQSDPTNKNFFDWSGVNTYLAQCVAKNKFASISFSAGIWIPAFVIAAGAQTFVEHGPDPGTIPLPWDPIFLQYYKKFIRAFADLYDSHPQLRGVVMGGMGQVVETVICNAGDYAAFNALAVAAGFLDLADGWNAGAEELTSYWIKSMRTTQCYASLNAPVPVPQGGLVALTNYVNWGIDNFKGRFGIMNAGLNGSSVALDTGSINDLIHDNSTRNPVGFQFGHSSLTADCDPTQDPNSYIPSLGYEHALDAGIAMGAWFEEIYEEDALNVTAPYPDDTLEAQTDLHENAVSGGGGSGGQISSVKSLAAFADTTDSATYARTIITPAVSSLLIAVVSSIRGGSTDPGAVTLTDTSGLTWVKIKSDSDFAYVTSGTSRARIAVYAAKAPVIPIPITITATFGGVCSGEQLHVFEVIGSDVANGVAQCFPQSVNSTANSAAGVSVSLTLAAASNAKNRAFLAVTHFANEAHAPRAGWVEISDVHFSSPNLASEAQWRSDAFETTVSSSWATSALFGAIAFEVKSA